MEHATAPGRQPGSAGSVVTVAPAIGASWLGVVVDVGVLGEDVAGAVEVPCGYVLVRCSDPLFAPGLVAGHVYLVLARFLGPAA